MSTFTAEPGTRLGGRYRLEDRVAAAAGWAAWKAIDETLARAVTVITFSAGFPRVEEVLTAARAASRMTDARLAQVFDVEDDWDNAYIVMEWAAGETLGDLLTGGPLDPVAGARIVAEAAAALSVAHAAGLAHLCLTPESLRWTSGGGVKITGIGIDAALSGTTAEDPALADTRGLGRLLYAAITGLWPGADYPAMAPAPFTDGHPRRPRQVRAGVPAALDEVTSEAMQLPGRGGAVLITPGQLAGAIAAELPPEEVPPASPLTADMSRAASALSDDYWPGTGRQAATGELEDWRQQEWRQSRRAEPHRADPRRPQRRRRSRARGLIAAALVLAVVAGIIAASLSLWPRHPAVQDATGPAAHPSSPSTQAVTTLKPASASGFDALNLADTGNENSAQAANVLNHDPAGWSSQWYGSAKFGGLKTGTGFLLNMGQSVRLSSLTVRFGSIPGANVEIKIGDSDTRSSQNLTTMTTVASATDVSGSHTFPVSSNATGQYIVIWFTQVPQVSAGKYMAQIYSVAVKGVRASG